MLPSRVSGATPRGVSHDKNAIALRRALRTRGLSPATWIPEASEGRAVEASVQPARIVEGHRLDTMPVGPAEPWPEPVGFVDGVQRYQIIGYRGALPLVLADIAAAVRQRRHRVLRTRAVEREQLAIGRPAVLEAVADLLGHARPIPLPDEDETHPVLDIHASRRVVDHQRGVLERRVAARYREETGGWLIVDGSLAESPAWAADRRMVGVVKSHATLPFGGEPQVTYLQTPYGHRTSIFAPASHRVAPVYSWALRVWPWEGRDLFHGLIRVETAPSDGAIEMANQIGRWLLAERAPVSTPDPRWDRLLYGIHDVEVYLKSRMG